MDVIALGGDEGSLGPADPDHLGQHPGVNTLDGHDLVPFQKIDQGFLFSPVGREGCQFFDDEPFHPRPVRFYILGITAIIPDQGIGHGHDLAVIGRVGEDFLVAGHGGVEDDLPLGTAVVADGLSGEECPVL